MFRVVVFVALLMLGAGSATAEITCVNDGRIIRVRASPRARLSDIFVFQQSTRCFESEFSEIDKAKASCDMLITAYGKKAGRHRCQRLLRRLGLDY